MTERDSNLEKFDHLVVLMLENRSFDHMLGYLYEDAQPDHFLGRGEPEFRGVAGLRLSNSDGGNPPKEVFVGKAPYESQEDMTQPSPDPGETYQPHVNRQVYGQDVVSDDTSPLPDPAPMSGFVQDYIRTHGPKHDPAVVMQSFPPEAVPILSGLARNFAVSDEWFASVPSQTYCNRSFLHSAQSHGYVRNANYVKWPAHNVAPTIFETLAKQRGQEAWRLYSDPQEPFSITQGIHPRLQGAEWRGNFRDFGHFERDCENGDLPAYTFIEPRLFVNHNDMHPPAMTPFVHSSVLAGEMLVNDVYNAVRRGKCWERTLLLVTFDEHGGCYDHWPPPLGAKPPGGNHAHPGESGFCFDRFGVRVPAIFVSPFVEPRTVVRAVGDVPFDHTSVIQTICQRFGAEGLTRRDRAAEGFSHVLQRSLDDPRRETPELTPRPYTPHPFDLAVKGPLTALARAVLQTATRATGDVVKDGWRVIEAFEHAKRWLEGRSG